MLKPEDIVKLDREASSRVPIHSRTRKSASRSIRTTWRMRGSTLWRKSA